MLLCKLGFACQIVTSLTIKEFESLLCLGLFVSYDNICGTGQKAAGSKHIKTKQKAEQPKVSKRFKEADAAGSSAAPVKGKAKAKKGAQRQRKGKPASRVGLINPTAEEMKTAFSQLNPHNRSVISMQDISRVC